MPGTYFWHDHAAMYRADGLQGPLIVRERPGTPPLTPSDGESTLLLLDWWHFPGNSLMMRLSRWVGAHFMCAPVLFGGAAACC
jgi:FtsP/CotA-like multicopper oxidase with cupredoxin domain